MQKPTYEFQIVHWETTAELEVVLNQMTNDNWRVDTHKLTDKGDSGWTIFLRTSFTPPNLLDRTINVGTVYNILNKTLVPGSDLAHVFDKGIKNAVREEGDTF
jgi:hypothetical protein